MVHGPPTGRTARSPGAYPRGVSSDVTERESTTERPTRAPSGMAPMLLVGGLLAAVLAAGLLALTGGNRYVLQGLSDPGLLTEHGLIVVRVLTEIGCAVCVGSLLFAAFMVPPQRSGTLDVDGYAAVRTASIAAAVWFVGSLLMVPFTVADSIGEPVTRVFNISELLNLMDALPDAKAWFITALVVLVVFVGTRFVLSWGWTAALFFVAMVGVVPIAVTGHSSAGGAHDLATNSLLLHLAAPPSGSAAWSRCSRTVAGAVPTSALPRPGSRRSRWSAGSSWRSPVWSTRGPGADVRRCSPRHTAC